MYRLVRYYKSQVKCSVAYLPGCCRDGGGIVIRVVTDGVTILIGFVFSGTVEIDISRDHSSLQYFDITANITQACKEGLVNSMECDTTSVPTGGSGA